ncbi:DUF883 family protein [Frigidibacter oleivorans]|uniref:DUF883 family protein n=1 Tax=Frigidibacter oleivorans TaxID=2487129 RepID=UPI0013DEF4A3|nr:DUF883 family protein [Frigidibacter oleivorans]
MAREPDITNGNGKVAQADYEALSQQIAALKSDLAGITGTLADMGRHQSRYAAAQARATADQLRDAGAEQVEALRLRANDAVDQADAFVKERPGTAVAIAAALGFILGLASSRR